MAADDTRHVWFQGGGPWATRLQSLSFAFEGFRSAGGEGHEGSRPVGAVVRLRLRADRGSRARGRRPPRRRPSPPLAAQQRLRSRLEVALVNRTDITDPTGAYANAADPSYDDSPWRTVDLPHDWSIELDPTPEGTTSDTGYFQGGLGWYRKSFTLPRSAAGKSVSLEFDGVYMDSVVFLNGKQVASHPYGYTGFAVDLDDAHADGQTRNVVAVEVRNKLPSSRWYSGSGIYRNVHLVVTDPVHVARHGAFVTTPDVESTFKQGYAKVHVRTDVVGATAATSVVTSVQDARGRTVAGGRPATPQDGTATNDLRLAHPHLWSTDDPYLYTLTTEVRQGRRTVDRTTTTFGVRWLHFDPAQGFSLNGHAMKLRGVDLHHDEGALGAAVNKDALMRQMRTMKSMGVNAFRTSHNPPSPEMIEVCQELGIVMMVEAFDTWRTPKRKYDYGRFFDANSDSDIAEMVNAAKNSPAVVLWSIGNEIPDSTSATVGLPIAKRLVADIKAIDTTRPIVIGSDKYRSVPATGSGADLILGQLDGLGLNYNTAASVDALHVKYPNTFLFESESSSETSSRGVYQDPDQLNTGENYTPGKRATSSYDNNLASWTMSGEYGLKKDRDRKYFQGQFLWSGTDYIGEPTPYNVFPVKSSFFGAVDTAGFPKDAYWLYRSQWAKDPMVHLLPMNWTDHEPGEPVQVWAYANVDTVELFLNGHSLGVRRFDHKTTVDGRPYLETTEATGDDKTVTSAPYPGSYTSPKRRAGKLHLTWDVPFAPGKLVAVASRDGHQVARDEVDTAGPPAAVRLTPDKRIIAADGRSLSYFTTDVVDAHGVLVPGADNAISFDVRGAGRLVGLDNGRQEDAENSGKADTLPAAMIDGDPATAWSNYYLKEATALLPAFSLAHPREWVSVAWPGAQSVSSVRVAFTIDATHALPADIGVRYWDGTLWAAVSNPHVAFASASGQPTVVSFDPVTTTRLRLDLTSAHPKAGDGFLAISELEVPGVALH